MDSILSSIPFTMVCKAILLSTVQTYLTLIRSHSLSYYFISDALTNLQVCQLLTWIPKRERIWWYSFSSCNSSGLTCPTWIRLLCNPLFLRIFLLMEWKANRKMIVTLNFMCNPVKNNLPAEICSVALSIQFRFKQMSISPSFPF